MNNNRDILEQAIDAIQVAELTHLSDDNFIDRKNGRASNRHLPPFDQGYLEGLRDAAFVVNQLRESEFRKEAYNANKEV